MYCLSRMRLRRRQRIDGRIDAEFRDRARQHDRGVKVRERRRRRGVRNVVGRHVDGLHRGDRTVARRGNSLLQIAHLRRQRRLVTHRAWHTSQQRGHLRTGLREAEDVVDEHQHVSVLGIAEVLGHGETRQRHAQARSRRLVHLPVDQRHLVRMLASWNSR